MIARSSAIHSMLFAASSAQRSPFFNPRAARNARACPTRVSTSLPCNRRRLAFSKLLQDRSTLRLRRAGRKCFRESSCACVGAGALTCPAERSSAILECHKTIWRAGSPAQTRTSCPYVVLLAERFDQLLQPLTHRRQIIFPAPFALASGKLGIPPLHFFFEVHTHAGHDFQIFHNRLSDSH